MDLINRAVKHHLGTTYCKQCYKAMLTWNFTDGGGLNNDL